MCNTDPTIVENIRYFIYKYNLLYDDWFRYLNRIYEKLDAHVQNQLGPRYEGQLILMAEPNPPSQTSPSYALTTLIIFRFGRAGRDR